MSSMISICLATGTTLVRIRETRFNDSMEIGLPDTEREIVVMPLEEPVPAPPEELPAVAPEPEHVPA
jgi:hypothetical protein